MLQCYHGHVRRRYLTGHLGDANDDVTDKHLTTLCLKFRDHLLQDRSIVGEVHPEALGSISQTAKIAQWIVSAAGTDDTPEAGVATNVPATSSRDDLRLPRLQSASAPSQSRRKTVIEDRGSSNRHTTIHGADEAELLDGATSHVPRPGRSVTSQSNHSSRPSSASRVAKPKPWGSAVLRQRSASTDRSDARTRAAKRPGSGAVQRSVALPSPAGSVVAEITPSPYPVHRPPIMSTPSEGNQVNNTQQPWSRCMHHLEQAAFEAEDAMESLLNGYFVTDEYCAHVGEHAQTFEADMYSDNSDDDV